MRIVMFGTGPFAVPTFEFLLQSSHKVVALVTRPIDDPGERRKTAANPMRDVAVNAGLSPFDPRDVNEADCVLRLRQLQADLFVVCDFGQILSGDCLRAARLGGVNLHGSLLPKYRGAAPINWAIYRGDTVTGVSVIHMTGKLDGGPILTEAQLAIEHDETTAELEPRLSRLGVEPVARAIEMLATWNGHDEIGRRQDPALATHARRLRKDDGLIRWSRPANRIVNQVRAFQPWPSTFTNLQRPIGPPIRIIALRASVIDDEINLQQDPHDSAPPVAQPGKVAYVDKNKLWVHTGRRLLSLDEVQPAGKKPMPVDAFLRGCLVRAGDQFA
jgi:methionyl-tRNA formyltransferase